MSRHPPGRSVADPAAPPGVLTDFDQLGAFFAGWDGRFEQVSAGRFAGRLRAVRGERLRLVEVELNQAVLGRGRARPGLFSAYLVQAGNAGSLWQGRRLRPGQLVVHGPDAETDHVTARRSVTAGLSLDAVAFGQAARALLGRDEAAIPFTWAASTPPPEAAARLDRAMRAMLGAAPDPTWPTSAEGRGAEQRCLQAVVEALVPAVGRPADVPLAARAALLRRAEGLMRANLAAPLGAVDLCVALGASDRTLRLAFRERYGLGPMAYFKVLRLNAVRAALKDEPTARVSSVARRYGFHHLGNFAADYRRAFGESPSETLGRSCPF